MPSKIRIFFGNLRKSISLIFIKKWLKKKLREVYLSLCVYNLPVCGQSIRMLSYKLSQCGLFPNQKKQGQTLLQKGARHLFVIKFLTFELMQIFQDYQYSLQVLEWNLILLLKYYNEKVNTKVFPTGKLKVPLGSFAT